MEKTQERRVFNSLHPRPIKAKIFTLPSLTVPDQTMSVRTLLERYAKGLPLEGEKEQLFEEEGMESDGINPKTLDFVDFQELREDNRLKIKNLQEKFEKLKAKPEKGEQH